jgi:AcrR family transcriptional regulator
MSDDRPADPVRVALLDAAHTILAGEGPGALTVRRIASSAGVSTINVYSRFGGKHGVVEALFATGFQRFTDALTAAPHGVDPLRDLLDLVRAYRTFALDNPTYYTIMFDRPVPDFRPSPESAHAASDSFLVLVHAIERAIAAGVLAPADPHPVAISVWATCHGLVSLELTGTTPRPVDWPTAYDATFHALFAGLAREGWGTGAGLS